MRLVTVSHGPVFGGAHNQMLRLSQPLLSHGIETLPVLPDEPGNAAGRLREGGLEVTALPLQRLRATADPGTQLRFGAALRGDIRRLRGAIRSLGADVVQVHGPTNPQAAIAASLEEVPVVWQLLDTRAPAALRRLTMPLVTRLADVVMTTGLAVADAHPGAAGLGERLVPYVPPVDTLAFASAAELRPLARRELALPDRTIALGTVGNLNPQKGHEWLLRAAARVRQGGADVRVRILGARGDAHPGLADDLRREAATLGLESPDRFDVVDPGARVRELLPALDVFLMTAVPRSEGMPTAVIEAMACGLPVVATDVGGVRELVDDGETGFVVPPLDAGAIAAAAGRLAGDGDLRGRMGAAGATRARERLDIALSVEQHLQAYRQAASRRRTEPMMGRHERRG